MNRERNRIYLEIRQQALREGNIRKMYGGKENGIEECLGRLLNELQDYLEITYDFDDSRLSHLRKIFPDFRWEYHGYYEVSGPEEMRRIAAQSDYLFLEKKDSDWTYGFITASSVKKRRTPLRIFHVPILTYLPSYKNTEPMWPCMYDSPDSFGFRFIYFNPVKMEKAEFI